MTVILKSAKIIAPLLGLSILADGAISENTPVTLGFIILIGGGLWWIGRKITTLELNHKADVEAQAVQRAHDKEMQVLQHSSNTLEIGAIKQSVKTVSSEVSSVSNEVKTVKRGVNALLKKNGIPQEFDEYNL